MGVDFEVEVETRDDVSDLELCLDLEDTSDLELCLDLEEASDFELCLDEATLSARDVGRESLFALVGSNELLGLELYPVVRRSGPELYPELFLELPSAFLPALWPSDPYPEPEGLLFREKKERPKSELLDFRTL